MFAAVIDKRAVAAAFQIEVGRGLFEKGGSGGGPADVGTESAPEVAESLAGVAALAVL